MERLVSLARGKGDRLLLEYQAATDGGGVFRRQTYWEAAELLVVPILSVPAKMPFG